SRRSTLFPYTTLFRSRSWSSDIRDIDRRDCAAPVPPSREFRSRQAGNTESGQGKAARANPREKQSQTLHSPAKSAIRRNSLDGRSEEHTSELQSPCNI